MTKRFTTEKAVHFVLTLAFIALFTIPNLRIWKSDVPRILSYFTTLFAWVIVFYSQAFWLFPKYFLNRKISRYFLFLILIITGLSLLHSTFQTMDFQKQVSTKYHIHRTFFEAYLYFYRSHLSRLMEIVIVLLVSISYSGIKVLIQRGFLKVKTFIISTCVVLVVTFISIAGLYHYKSSYKGGEGIIFMNKSDEYKTIGDLFKQKELKGNVLYIDIWGPNCGPCIQEFKNLKNLKERYKNEQVKFIYLAFIKPAFIKQSADAAKWKDIIKKYEITGYHMQINVEFYENIWTIEGIRDLYCIPHYIIIDKNGNITNPNAERPSSGEKLYQQLDNVLHQ